MQIKSIIDVITNSSSECYLVKTNLPIDECKERFIKEVEKLWDEKEEFNLNNFNNDPTYSPRIERLYPGSEVVRFSWDILCNLGCSYNALVNIFGKENIKDEDCRYC